MQSGNSHPSVAVNASAEDEYAPPLTSNVIVYCAAGCVVADSVSLSTLTVEVGDMYSVPTPPSAPAAPPVPPSPP